MAAQAMRTTGRGMATPIEAPLPFLRLLQLASPSLPVGAFAYSQGLEWAVEAGWISDEQALEHWLSDQLLRGLASVDLALLVRLMSAIEAGDTRALSGWIDELLAMRETAELRAEEAARGRALAELLDGMGLLAAPAARAPEATPPRPTRASTDGRPVSPSWKPLLARSQLAGFAFAANAWEIGRYEALLGYAWSWSENLVLAGVKLVPLGQTAGQRLLLRLATQIPDAVDLARSARDADIGTSSPALALASSLHETQYTRLYRS
jgi:urease accessory protein